MATMLKFAVRSTNYLKPSISAILTARSDIFLQQIRNTFILKRKYEVALHKKHKKPKLRPQNFIYEFIENTECKPQEMVKVILMKDVEYFGPKGAIIAVKSMKAYECLLLPKLAVYASPENVQKYATKDLTVKDALDLSPTTLAVKHLSTLLLSVVMSLDNPWVLDKSHMRISFRKAGIHVPEDAITMPNNQIKGPNLDFEQKQFYVTVQIDETTSVRVRCTIHHYSPDLERQLPKVEQFWLLQGDAIFPEDQEILNSLPKHRQLQKKLDADNKLRITDQENAKSVQL